LENKLTVTQAFDAMTCFLISYWKKTGSDEVANLLSDMNTELWADGSTADPAIWGEWVDSINVIIKTEKEDTLTVLQAFQAMGKFLEQYIPFNTPSEVVDNLKKGIHIHQDGSIANSVFWKHWVQCVNDTLRKK
jgi:hypothetical protein